MKTLTRGIRLTPIVLSALLFTGCRTTPPQAPQCPTFDTSLIRPIPLPSRSGPVSRETYLDDMAGFRAAVELDNARKQTLINQLERATP